MEHCGIFRYTCTLRLKKINENKTENACVFVSLQPYRNKRTLSMWVGD